MVLVLILINKNGSGETEFGVIKCPMKTKNTFVLFISLID